MNVIQVFIAEMSDAGSDGAQGRVAQGTEALAADVVADIEKKVNVLFAPLAVLDAVQNLVKPINALTARETLATVLVAEEGG